MNLYCQYISPESFETNPLPPAGGGDGWFDRVGETVNQKSRSAAEAKNGILFFYIGE